MAPLRLSPFDRNCRNAPSPLPPAAVTQDTSRAESFDCTLVQLCLIRADDEESAFIRLSQIARPVARLKLGGYVMTPQRPSRDGHQDCRPNDGDASSTKRIVRGDVPVDQRDKTEGDQRGG